MRKGSDDMRVPVPSCSSSRISCWSFPRAFCADMEYYMEQLRPRSELCAGCGLEPQTSNGQWVRRKPPPFMQRFRWDLHIGGEKAQEVSRRNLSVFTGSMILDEVWETISRHFLIFFSCFLAIFIFSFSRDPFSRKAQDQLGQHVPLNWGLNCGSHTCPGHFLSHRPSLAVSPSGISYMCKE